MTVILVRTLVSGITNPIPKAAKITFTPWGGYRSVTRIEDTDIIFPKPTTVDIAASGVTRIPIEATTSEWCWNVSVEINGHRPYSRFFLVPDVAEIEFEDLVEVDPKTYEPIETPSNTRQLLDEANLILESVLERTLTATVDPNDPDVLILDFPSYMLSAADRNVLVIPVGG